jgi:hypothetical protein
MAGLSDARFATAGGAAMGTKSFVEPIAPVEAATRRIPAGAVTFGLEMRQLSPAIVADFYAGRADEEVVKDLVEHREQGVGDDGPTIHVFGTRDGLEYLRFDCFHNEPHYHYIKPHEDFQVVHEIDVVALGDPFEWSTTRIRSRLGEMLRESGGAEIADQIDDGQIRNALHSLEQLYQSVPPG